MAIEPPPPRSTSCSRAISSPPFHRLRSDEVWHFYAGSGLIVHVITPAGEYQQLLLGSSNPASGEHFQGVVPAGCWFGSSLRQPETFALVGCTVAPGFDFADFEMAKREELIAQCPQHRNIIERLTRDELDPKSLSS